MKNETEKEPPKIPPVRRWSSTTKKTVILFVVVLLSLVVYRFQDVIPPLVIALLLAFILDPIADFLTNRLRLSRGLASAIVILILIIAMAGMAATPVAVVPTIQQAVESMQEETTDVINEIGRFFNQPPITFLGYELDLGEFYDELSQLLRTFVSSVAQETINIVLSIASGLLWLIFILMITFYLLKDADRLIEQLDRLPPQDYRQDFVRLRQQIADVWNAFLRGQLLLGVVIAVVTTAGCMALGIRYAPVLGLLAGLLEVVPSIGPTIAAVPAILLALFQENTLFGMSNFWYAVLVAGMYIVIQQLENNLIVPRILGRSLNLHPVLVLIAVVVGGSLGGVLGILLAAPTLATIRVIGRYIFYRIYDLDPFAEADETEEIPSPPGLLERMHKAALDYVHQRGSGKSTAQDTSSADDTPSDASSDGADENA
ncbi:MAG: AI-2E family transporter [Anaerolineae bacterium]|jgi:predicted PurR-regulated permease PerM